MGEVWRATDRTLGRTVAAKVLKSEYTGDRNFLERFRNEARHTAGLAHANIASVYDYGETQDDDGRTLAFLVMEYVEGEPLVAILDREITLSPERTLDVLAQAGEGLSAAHRAGVVHRDIKPGNLMVRPDGVVKLTDFGIAWARDAAPLTRTGMVVGTAQYLSPEQAQGFQVTAASDVYSLGILGYECLAGNRPFDGDSQVAIALAQINRPPPPLPAAVPAPVRALVEKALSKDPAARFADGGAFAAGRPPDRRRRPRPGDACDRLHPRGRRGQHPADRRRCRAGRSHRTGHRAADHAPAAGPPGRRGARGLGRRPATASVPLAVGRRGRGGPAGAGGRAGLHAAGRRWQRGRRRHPHHDHHRPGDQHLRPGEHRRAEQRGADHGGADHRGDRGADRGAGGDHPGPAAGHHHAGADHDRDGPPRAAHDAGLAHSSDHHRSRTTTTHHRPRRPSVARGGGDAVSAPRTSPVRPAGSPTLPGGRPIPAAAREDRR